MSMVRSVSLLGVSFVSSVVLALSLGGCGSGSETQDYSGVAGSCTKSKSFDAEVENEEGAVEKVSVPYKECTDTAYSGKLKEDPKTFLQDFVKELCIGGTYSKSTCSQKKVAADCGYNEQSTEVKDSGTVTLKSQHFIYEEGVEFSEDFDAKKELCK
jgi:hypothetical protein